MLRTPRIPVAVAHLAAAALIAALVVTPGSKAHAQAAQGATADLEFAVHDATTGRAGTVDRLTIEYLSARPDLVLDIQPQDTTFTVSEVPIKGEGKYVVTAWKDGVPYYFSRRGSELTAGPVTLNVFDTTTDRSAVRITGMNVFARIEESLLQLEVLLQVSNDASPQATVVGSPGSFGLALPAGLTDVSAEYHRGLEPTPVRTAREGGLLELAVPLVSGTNKVRLTGTIPWQEGLVLTVGADVPVDAWSLMVAPDWAEVTNLELEPDPSGGAGGYKRFRGPELEAGRVVEVRLGSGRGTAGTTEKVFGSEAAGDSAAAAATPPAPGKKGGGLPLAVIIALAVVVLVLVLRRRRG